MDELIRLTATQAVEKLKRGEVTPLDLIDAAERRIAAVEPAINALPTLCLDRARDHARRLMAGQGREAEGEPGWLAGLPVAIKDLQAVAGVRTTMGSPIYADHMPDRSHPVVARIERKGGIVIAKSNTPEFGAGGSTFNEVFGRTRNPWNTSLTPAGSTGGGAAALAAGEVWLAQGTDHGGSLRRPATYCAVVGLRPSPGRVTRGTVDSLFSPMSVQGPMARTAADVALFLDTMAGFCPLDPMTFDAPAQSFADAVANPVAPKRVAYAESIAGEPVDRETRALCRAAMKPFEAMGAAVEEIEIAVEGLEDMFMALRGQVFVVSHEPRIAQHRDLIKPDIVWNTELGQKLTMSQLAAAERARARLYAQFAALFRSYDLIVTPGANTPAFDVNLRMPRRIDGRELAHYLGGSLLTGAITLSASPALAVPCGFDQYGRPIGLQLVGRPRGEAALLAAGALYEAHSDLPEAPPIDPRVGTVPPD